MLSAWEDGPSATSVQRMQKVWVHTPTFYKHCWGILLSNTSMRRRMHYDTMIGQAVPCTRTDRCPYCKHGIRWRYQCYLCAQTPKSHTPMIFHLSEHATEMFDAAAKITHGFRGMIVKTSRADRRKTGKMLFEVLERADVPHLIPAFDVRPHLERLWGQSIYGQLIEESNPHPTTPPAAPACIDPETEGL